jgi:hypothetical protein
LTARAERGSPDEPAEDYPAAFRAVTSGRIDALMALGNPVNFKHRQLADFARTNRLPGMYEERRSSKLVCSDSRGLLI